jgi:translation initiation factor 2 alpha subunit (eIF-2alpha)
MVNAENNKVAEGWMNNTIQKTPANIEKQQGTLNFMHQHSKRSQTLQQYRLRNEASRKKVSFV